MRATLAACLTLALVVGASAADLDEVEIPAAVEAREIVFDLGAAVTFGPKFPAARVYEPGGAPLFRLKFLRLPGLGEVVTEKKSFISVFPSFEYTDRRDVDDAAYLRGIPDRDFSLGIGPGVVVQYGALRAYAEARYGFIGHNGFVGEVGADLVGTPFERLEVSLGPRVGWADDEYMEYYFGVPASALVLPAYDPSGGIKDVGARFQATYTINEKWRLHGRAEYRHYVGEAGDSPIVDEGNDTEIEVGVGLTYRFGFDLF
ncbi:MAG: MipA/OmpV family protein [Pseudomonadota bacterium]